MSKNEILVGSHISSAGHLYLAFQRGESINCSVMQIFTKSGRTWAAPVLKNDEIKEFIVAAKKSSICVVIAHAGYLINIGSTKTDSVHKSIKSLINELVRCELLQIPYLVLHPGSHLGAGETVGLEQVTKNLEFVLESVPGKTAILLETMAGQGTNLGYKFEQLASIIGDCKPKYKKRLGVCFDTCHTFASGYKFSSKSDCRETFKLFDKIIGLDKLKAIHMNDSFGAQGSKIDRHAPLGKGKIPLDVFELIMNDKELWSVPKILETPSDFDMKLWAHEIKLLRNMIKN